MDEREAALTAMQSALKGTPVRREMTQGTGAMVADAFAELERDDVYVKFVMMHESHVEELRNDPGVGLEKGATTLWGAEIVESKDMSTRLVVACGFEDESEWEPVPKAALVAW